MTRLSDQLEGQGPTVEADPLPEDFDEGDSSDTEVVDDNDTPPGIDSKGAK